MTHPSLVKVGAVLKVYRTYSKPYLVEGTDGSLYILKHASASADKKLLAGEYFATKAGLHITAPVLGCDLIEVDDDGHDLLASFSGRNGAPIPDKGIHYASIHKDGLPASESDMNSLFDNRSKVLNSDKASHAVVFDSLFHNHDGHPGNVLISFPDKAKKTEFEVHLIDQGHILRGPTWAALSAPGHWVYLGARANFFKVDGSGIKASLPRTEADLKTLTPAVLDGILAEIPAEWGLTAATADQLKTFVTARIPRACGFIKENLTLKGH